MKKIFDKRNLKTAEEWQEYRQKQGRGDFIGGSEVATILGINPFKSKFLLWLEKTGQTAASPVSGEAVEWGNLLEPVIREKFKQETGFKVYQNNFVLQHDTYPFMLANIDGECLDPAFSGRGILEIKTTGEHNRKQWESGVPVYYLAQIQHYLAVTGYEYAYCAVLIGGRTFKYFLIDRDEYIIDKIITAEIEFMEHIHKMIPPQIGGSKVESEWLEEAFPEAIDEEMFISPAIEELALEYQSLSVQVKDKTKRMEEIKNHIRLVGKEFKTLRGTQILINMPTVNKILFDSKKFSSEHPELYNNYKNKPSSYRSFDIKILED